MEYSINDIIEDNKKILKKLYDDDPTVNESINSVDAFRGKLLDFINNSLGQVKRTQALLDLVDAKIVNLLLLNEYDKDELLQLRRELVSASNTKTSVLLEPFKPTNNSGNSLITPPSTANEATGPIKELSPDERMALDKLARFMEQINKKKKIVSEEEEE